MQLLCHASTRHNTQKLQLVRFVDVFLLESGKVDFLTDVNICDRWEPLFE